MRSARSRNTVHESEARARRRDGFPFSRSGESTSTLVHDVDDDGGGARSLQEKKPSNAFSPLSIERCLKKAQCAKKLFFASTRREIMRTALFPRRAAGTRPCIARLARRRVCLSSSCGRPLSIEEFEASQIFKDNDSGITEEAGPFKKGRNVRRNYRRVRGRRG